MCSSCRYVANLHSQFHRGWVNTHCLCFASPASWDVFSPAVVLFTPKIPALEHQGTSLFSAAHRHFSHSAVRLIAAFSWEFLPASTGTTHCCLNSRRYSLLHHAVYRLEHWTLPFISPTARPHRCWSFSIGNSTSHYLPVIRFHSTIHLSTFAWLFSLNFDEVSHLAKTPGSISPRLSHSPPPSDISWAPFSHHSPHRPPRPSLVFFSSDSRTFARASYSLSEYKDSWTHWTLHLFISCFNRLQTYLRKHAYFTYNCSYIYDPCFYSITLIPVLYLFSMIKLFC